MFKLFKRNAPAKAPPKRPVPNVAPAPSRSAPVFHEPPPVPDVVESHGQSGWDMWEHSSMQLDSQMSPLSAFDSVRVNTERPSQFSDDDPFAYVRRKTTR